MADEPCINEGLFCRIMVYLFGASWKTSAYAVATFLCAAAQLVQDYLVNINAPSGLLKGGALFFGLLALLNAKDKNVTGGSVQSK